MLWFDNSQFALKQKLQNAIEYYEKKHGRKPNLCFVHPSMLTDEERRERSVEMAGLTVRPYRPVLPGHIWVGIADEGDA